jgi:type II secretory pathway pseudopilin PulG
MSNLLTRKFSIPKFWMYFIYLLLLLFIFETFFSSPSHVKTKARIIATRGQIKTIAFFLDEYYKSNGHLPFGENSNIAAALSASFTNGFLNYPAWTNSHSELVDYWQTPLQIQIAGTTNFSIRSAGKDKFFSNADDIIFNSVSNDFVKP